MVIKIEYDKVNTFGEIEHSKEGTNAEKKDAKNAVKMAFKVFSLKPEAKVTVGDNIFSWEDFEKGSVKCEQADGVKILPLKKAEKIALRVK